MRLRFSAPLVLIALILVAGDIDVAAQQPAPPPTWKQGQPDTLKDSTLAPVPQPPKGSLMGMPSTSTSARLAPLGPTPRSDTPCVVGCPTRLDDRRNKLNDGTWRSKSSSVT